MRGRTRDAMWGALAGVGATIAVSGLAFVLTMGLGLALAGVGSLIGWRPGVAFGWIGLAVGGVFGAWLVAAMLDQGGWRGVARVAFVVAFSVSASAGTALSPAMADDVVDRGAAALVAGLITAVIAGATVLGPHRPPPMLPRSRRRA